MAKNQSPMRWLLAAAILAGLVLVAWKDSLATAVFILVPLAALLWVANSAEIRAGTDSNKGHDALDFSVVPKGLSNWPSFREIANTLPVGVLLIGRTAPHLQWLNEQAGIMLDLTERDAVLQAELFQQRNPQLIAWIAQDGSEEFLYEGKDQNQQSRFLSCRKRQLTDGRLLLIVQDVNRIRQLENIRKDFVANVSHELRTPLTVLHGYLELIDAKNDHELSEILKQMRSQSDRMMQLVEDLLELSQLEAREKIDESPHSIRAMMQMLGDDARALSAGRHQIQIKQDAEFYILGDRKELYSAFSNLLSNAIRYTPTSGQIEIGFEVLGDGRGRFYVTDDGYGIAANHLPRLTERFYRASTSRSREIGGTGVGLSMVRHVLLAHNATLDIQSEVGKGSCFSCIFPASRLLTAQAHAIMLETHGASE